MRDDPASLMVFAAGFGTRMGALTRDRPKPLLRVGGQTLLDRALDLGAGLPLETVVVNTHYRAEMIAAHLEGRKVRLSHEAPDILETGGGLKRALPLLSDGPAVTLNPDAVWAGPNPLSLLRAAWEPARMEALLLLIPPERASGRRGGGDFTLGPDGRLSRGGPAIYGGAQILRTERIAGWPETVFSLNAVWDAMAADGGLYGLVYPGHWCDVGTPDGIAEAEAMLRAESDV